MDLSRGRCQQPTRAPSRGCRGDRWVCLVGAVLEFVLGRELRHAATADLRWPPDRPRTVPRPVGPGVPSVCVTDTTDVVHQGRSERCLNVTLRQVERPARGAVVMAQVRSDAPASSQNPRSASGVPRARHVAAPRRALPLASGTHPHRGGHRRAEDSSTCNEDRSGPGGAPPVFPRHNMVGVVHADNRTLKRRRKPAK